MNHIMLIKNEDEKMSVLSNLIFQLSKKPFHERNSSKTKNTIPIVIKNKIDFLENLPIHNLI